MIANDELQELMAEHIEFALSQTPEALAAENAELRELCASLYKFAMSEYPDGTELNFADRMRELGAEVDG